MVKPKPRIGDIVDSLDDENKSSGKVIGVRKNKLLVSWLFGGITLENPRRLALMERISRLGIPIRRR